MAHPTSRRSFLGISALGLAAAVAPGELVRPAVENCAVKNRPARWSVKDHRPMSIGKIGPISVVTIPATTNPPCRATDAAEEVRSEAGRVWIELMLKAFCRNACLWPLRGQPRASGKM